MLVVLLSKSPDNFKTKESPGDRAVRKENEKIILRASRMLAREIIGGKKISNVAPDGSNDASNHAIISPHHSFVVSKEKLGSITEFNDDFEDEDVDMAWATSKPFITALVKEDKKSLALKFSAEKADVQNVSYLQMNAGQNSISDIMLASQHDI